MGQKLPFPGQLVMDRLTEDGKAQGIYPDTVAIKQRKDILSDTGKDYKFSSGGTNEITYKFEDDEGFTFINNVIVNNGDSKKTFNYFLDVEEDVDGAKETLLSFEVPISIEPEEDEYMQGLGFNLSSNNKKDPRKEIFKRIVKDKMSLTDDKASSIFEETYASINKRIVETLMEDPREDDKLPNGYKFGYVTDELTKDDFKYNKNTKKFENDRIVPLDPALHGGTENNPPFYVKPREFYGWTALSLNTFHVEEGCDPKMPPLLEISDIKDRVKTLGGSLRNDPRLGKPAKCVREKPFHLLIDSKNKAKLDGVVRTTLRTYIAEYFIKGYGLFSTLHVRGENFDQSMMMYIIEKMKREMSQIGTTANSRKVRLVRERYWYAFLEQCVEAYQRMVDIDGVEPPSEVYEALNRIQKGMDRYRPADYRTKRIMYNLVKRGYDITKPSKNYDSVRIASQGMVRMCLQAIAFRLTPISEKDDFFDGKKFEGIEARDIWYASIKKIQFFQKIYFIKLFEKEATLIMSELVRDELNRLSDSVLKGRLNKPYYYDLKRSFFGMTGVFPNSTSRAGLYEYYEENSSNGNADFGDIPEVQDTNAEPPVAAGDEPLFILEKYVRLTEKNIPEEEEEELEFITNRGAEYKGVVSLTKMSEFFSDNRSLMLNGYLSDYFGNLSFIYEGSLRNIFNSGFAEYSDVSRLIGFNRSKGAAIRNAHRSFVLGRNFQDFDVKYDESFVLPNQKPEPIETIGRTGVSYGLRFCVVLSESLAEDITKTGSIASKSKLEKSYVFQDGTVVIPLIETEVDVVDSRVEDFDPFTGVEPYDLECLVNKMTSQPEFDLIVDKVLGLRQAASMLAIYCMETLPAAIGRDETERENIEGNPDEDSWDRVVNIFGKNFLRRQFKYIYMVTHPDGQSDDNDDGEVPRLSNMRNRNPASRLASTSVRLPWWVKRRMKTKVFDADEEDCSDPKKDLQ